MNTSILKLSPLAIALVTFSSVLGCAPADGLDPEETTAQTAQADTAEATAAESPTPDVDPASDPFDPKSVESFEEYKDVDVAEVLAENSSMSAEQQEAVTASACARYTLGTRYSGLTYSQSVTWCWNGSRVTTAYRSARSGSTGGAPFWKFVGHIETLEWHGLDWAEFYTQGEFQFTLQWGGTEHQPEVEQWVDACGGYGGFAQFN